MKFKITKIFYLSLSSIALLSAIMTVNSACNIVIYEPKMPKSAEELIR